METIETTAATPVDDDGPVTLPNPLESNQDTQQEATALAEGDEDSIEALAKEALGETPEATPEEDVEIEMDGIKAKVPTPLKDAFLRHQDYTRKTMDLAEGRKAYEAERDAFKQSATQIAANFQGFVQLATLNAQIQQMAALDTTGWSPEQVQAGATQLARLQQQAAALNTNLTQTAQHRTQSEQAQFEQARQAAFQEAAARIPNFTDKRRAEIEAFAQDAGVPADALQEISSAWEWEVLHFADIGRKFIERQRKAATVKAAHAGTPAAMLGGANGGGSKDPANMSAAEYIAWRNAGNG